MAHTQLSLRGIDKQFYDLLITLAASNIAFPKRKIELNKEFFKKHSKQIFVNPSCSYNRVLENIKKLGLDFSKLPQPLQWAHKNSYIIAKTFALESFMTDLQKYCFWSGQLPQYYSVKYDLSRAVEAEFLKFLGNKGEEYYRDHTLHKGTTFLFGLWLYNESQYIREKHESMLKCSPKPPGCIAITGYGPNSNIRWQFFQQWFITASHHDMGRMLSSDTNLDTAQQLIFAINTLQQQFLTDPELAKVNYNPIRLNSDSSGKIYLDITPLYEINYKEVGETHISNTFWDECLAKARQFEDDFPLDHGINSAKILLKLANFSVKEDEARELEPWKRYSYRNYILPALAMANHNIDDVRTKTVQAEVGRNGREIRIEKKRFKEDFLTTLLICCDELAEFERMGSKNEVPLAMDFELQISENNTGIAITLKKRKESPQAAQRGCI